MIVIRGWERRHDKGAEHKIQRYHSVAGTDRRVEDVAALLAATNAATQREDYP